MTRRRLRITLSITLAGCTSHIATPSTTVTSPQPVSQSPVELSSTSRNDWTFRWDEAPHVYSSRSKTTIQLNPGTYPEKDTLLLTSEFTIRVTHLLSAESISGQVDSISITTGPKLKRENETIDSLHLPQFFTGTSSGGRLTLSLDVPPSSPQSSSCRNSVSSVLGEIRNQLVALPSNLSRNFEWTDTGLADICTTDQIISKLQIVRSYRVIGETTSIADLSLLIQRHEAIHLNGNGNLGQHQLSIEGEGTGSSQIYVQPFSDLVTAIESSQTLSLRINSPTNFPILTQKTEQKTQLIH